MPGDGDVCCGDHVVLVDTAISVEDSWSVDVEHDNADCQGSNYAALQGA